MARFLEDETGERPRTSGTNLLWRCPNPQHDDRNPSFSVHRRRETWRCWSQCDHGGSGTIDLAMWLWSLPYDEALERLASQYGIMARPVHDTTWRPNRKARHRKRPSQQRPDKPPGKPRRERYNTAPRPAPAAAAPLLDSYRRRRGWQTETVAAAGLEIVTRYVAVEGLGDQKIARPYVRHPHRRSTRAEPEFWQDRSVTPDPAPTPEGRSTRWLFPKAPLSIPFGLHTDTGDEPICLLEGPTDAITWTDIYPWAPTIALPGSGAIERWLLALAADPRPVVCITDNDKAGQAIRNRVLDHLGAQRVRVAVVPDPKRKGWDLNDWYVHVGRRPEHRRRLGSHPFRGAAYLNREAAKAR